MRQEPVGATGFASRQDKTAQLKVVIVHDWFVGGGAERVVLELHKMYPEAPIYTAYCSRAWREKLAPATIVTSYMQHWPLSRLRKFLPVFRAIWFSHLNLDGYDLVISSSGAEAKFIKPRPGAKHIAYIHAPTHYYWGRYDEYMKSPGFGALDPIARFGLKLLVGPMRRWDYKAAQRPDYLIANSTYTKSQIKKYYGRDSVVIHPPVDIKRFGPKTGVERHGLVIAGRQTPYKKIDLAVAACTKLNLPLTVIGKGPDHKKLVAVAGPTIKFIDNASDEEVAKCFAQAEAFIFPGVDDFGIVAVEALAAGTPVIAFGEGGALEYVEPRKTGLLFKPQTLKALIGVLKSFKADQFDNMAITKSAVKFSPEVFRQQFDVFLKEIGSK